MAFQLSELQSDIRAAKFDGWLFYDFRGRDPIAHRDFRTTASDEDPALVLLRSREGTPRKLVHKIETEVARCRAGRNSVLRGLRRAPENLANAIGRAKVIAMQCSPKAAVPYVAMVDAGTIRIRTRRRTRKSSAPPISCKNSKPAGLRNSSSRTWPPEKSSIRVIRGAFDEAAKHVRAKAEFHRVRSSAMDPEEFAAAEFDARGRPDVAVNANASDPHYGPAEGKLRRFAKAIFCCSMFGAKPKTRIASITMSHGSATSARKSPTNTPKSSPSCVTRATKLSI